MCKDWDWYHRVQLSEALTILVSEPQFLKAII
jgi:hypothetical protein